MKILIVEDEQHAAQRLEKMIADLRPNFTKPYFCDGIENTLGWLEKNGQPDLIFLDIHLSDGISFHLFEQTKITAPVIFTTAYDQYALKAFKVNSIDYLLKPIEKELLNNAIEKWETNKMSFQLQTVDWNGLAKQKEQFKNRFLVKLGDRLISVPAEQIDYFVSEEKLTILHTQGKKYVVDFSLEELEEMLSPTQFFRLNRKAIASISSIDQIHQHFNGKLKITLKPNFEGEELFVSREKSPAFKNWLGA